MSGHGTFAIWGAGNLGGRIADHLLDRGVTVIILTRPESIGNARNQDLISKGVLIRAFDVLSGDAAVDALKNVDVLVSTPANEALPLQSTLVTAAHAAGVRLFVPAEFGNTTDGRPERIHQAKVAVRNQAKQLGLPTAAFFTGFWPEFLVYRGFDLAAGQITIMGDGDSRMPATSIEDVASFVAYVLTSLPEDQLKEAKFTLQGDIVTFNLLAASVQELATKPLTVTRIPCSTLEDQLKANPDDIVAEVLLGMSHDQGLHPGQPSHSLYPQWKPKTVMEILKPLIP